MARVYFNGVGNVSFNGTLLSFVLDDTSKKSNGAVDKDSVVALITELDSAEGIFSFLLDEIKKIKKVQGVNLDRSNVMDEEKRSEAKPPSGIQITMTSHKHSD